MRYFGYIFNNGSTIYSIWMTDDKKTKEKLLWHFMNDGGKFYTTLKSEWRKYEPTENQTEIEMTEEEVFAELL